MFFHLLFLCTFWKHTIVWPYAPPAELHLELNKSMIDKLDDPEIFLEDLEGSLLYKGLHLLED